MIRGSGLFYPYRDPNPVKSQDQPSRFADSRRKTSMRRLRDDCSLWVPFEQSSHDETPKFIGNNWSWIVTAPIALLAIAPVAAVQQHRRARRPSARTSDPAQARS